MISRQPALRDAVAPLLDTLVNFILFDRRGVRVTYVLNYMAVITDEEDRAAVREVDLHAH